MDDRPGSRYALMEVHYMANLTPGVLSQAFSWLGRNPAEAALGVLMAATILKRLGWKPDALYVLTRGLLKKAGEGKAAALCAVCVLPAGLLESLIVPFEALAGLRIKPADERGEPIAARLLKEVVALKKDRERMGKELIRLKKALGAEAQFRSQTADSLQLLYGDVLYIHRELEMPIDRAERLNRLGKRDRSSSGPTDLLKEMSEFDSGEHCGNPHTAPRKGQ